MKLSAPLIGGLALLLLDCSVRGCVRTGVTKTPTLPQSEEDLPPSGKSTDEDEEVPRSDLSRACSKNTDCDTGYKCMASNCVLDVKCPLHKKFGDGPPASCSKKPADPNNLPKSKLESWFTKEVFNDLFPKANIGWGPDECWPFSYESFVIAARYFPLFGTESPDNGYTPEENHRRDIAGFLAHAVQETGENDASLYDNPELKTKEESDACFYRGGFFNWFEGGPISSFLKKTSPGYHPVDGEVCIDAGRYCASGAELDYWYPCNKARVPNPDDPDKDFNKGCYFGRGAIQISYNYNYGQFQQWLASRKIKVDILKEPNLVMTKLDPPLAVLASLWFYMTPQPPKPAMHDIIMGNWEPGKKNREAGYKGPIFGPTSLVINNECNGEDPEDPGGPGESRRIKAFKWFNHYFASPVEKEELLSCKKMPVKLEGIKHPLSYQPDWGNTWKEIPCDCAPASYGGMVPYFKKGYYPERFVKENVENKVRCIASIYDNPSMYSMDNTTSACLNYPLPDQLQKVFSFDPQDDPKGPEFIENALQELRG